ncbi:menaquinone biosynthetic enzyme MqnA/MqnD family protein [Marinicrinis lubricantis]|uniref:Chorismate dehydratase n=1 Tax=Marinicrinis lubricantis TaxID=2086470 RepID=A0ABW1IM18_9BACL
MNISTNNIESPIRIGQIRYTNVWPIFYHFPFEFFDEEIEFVEQVPSDLNRALAEGNIDLSVISSFAYAQHADNYVLLPNVSVSAHSQVKSIFLFHKKPLEELDGCRIALTNTSATSVHLLKIILERFVGVSPDYFYEQPDLDTMLQEADAALLIGDDAIKASWGETDMLVTDLGELWHHYTGTSMTFAVWAVRKQMVQEQPERIERIFHAFQMSKELSTRFPDEVADKAFHRIGGTKDFWLDYFGNLCYDFGPEEQKGLLKYYQYAYELGFLDKPVELEFWTHKTTV